MPVLYLHNFRGFNKTFLPLKDVNFFVGENSAGKTSVLKLFKLLTDRNFWFSNEFSSEEVDLVYYNEITNSSNLRNKYFDVGMFGQFSEKGQGITAIRIRYIDIDGFPKIKTINFIVADLNVEIVLDSKGCEYRHSTFNINRIPDAIPGDYFKRWVQKSGLNHIKFKRVEGSTALSEFPLFFIIQIVVKEINNARGTDTRIIAHMPAFMHEIAWIAPIRTDPKRTYDNYRISFNSDGTHAPYLLKKMLSPDISEDKRDRVKTILQQFGKDSGLFDEIVITPFGKGATSPFELSVKLKKQLVRITNVGYGVSQILPIIIEVIDRQAESWFGLQQPEIHLHPRGQAAFGDFILKSAMNDGKKFIVETHSDYTIDRFRLKLSQQATDSGEVAVESQIVFFNRKNSGNMLTCIPIQSNGSLSDEQPAEFRSFFLKEQLAMFEI